MKNIHIAIVIVLLLIGAVYTVVTRPTRMGLDIQGGMRVVLRAQKEQLKSGAWSADKLETVAGIIRNRVDALGVAEPVIYTKPDQDQIVVELPGIRNKQQALEAIQTTARLEFRYVPELESTWRTEEETIDGRPTGYERIVGPNGPVSKEELEAKVFSKPAILAGDELEPNSRAELTPQGTVVHFEFKGNARRVFEEFTRTHLNKPLAVFLDKKLISAPIIEDVIPGVGIIRGRFSPEQARTLASQLNAGALPVPLELQQQLNVEATLGRQAVDQTRLAGIIGLVAVLIFMLLYYRFPGFLADIALLLYATFTFAIFEGALSFLGFPGVTLTVPGIAGFILSIGMAVDANILIFERMKEERLAGKSLRSAIEAGFKRAFTAIFDSNMCTLITCAILYHFGTGPVRGFAVTLAIGVLVSMFTAITCTRTFLLLLADTRFGQNERLYPHHTGLHPQLGVTKRMGFWFGLSGLIIVPGLIYWLGLGGIRYSIEFTGGTEIGVQYSRRPSVAEITRTMANLGHREVRIVLAEGNRASINTKLLSQEEQTRVTDALKAQGATVESLAKVSGAISRELTRNAIMSVVWASVLIVLYLAFRFSIGGFVEGLKFGVCAIIAMLHDVLVVWGLFAIFGHHMGWQIDSLFVTAMLTVIGFSVHDTIVIFDRIRENLRHRAKTDTFADVTDRSIEQTFARSINTSLTVVITLVALLLFGGPVARLFVTALLVGIVSGTYSSIFNASPLLVLLKRWTGDRLETVPVAAGVAPRATPRPIPRPSPPPAAPRSAPPSKAADTNGAREATEAPQERVSAGGGTPGAKTRKRKRRM